MNNFQRRAQLRKAKQALLALESDDFLQLAFFEKFGDNPVRKYTVQARLEAAVKQVTEYRDGLSMKPKDRGVIHGVAVIGVGTRVDFHFVH
jgi:hypothetical protein